MSGKRSGRLAKGELRRTAAIVVDWQLVDARVGKICLSHANIPFAQEWELRQKVSQIAQKYGAGAELR